MIPGTVLFTRNFQYPLLLPRRYWMSITRLESVILALYFGANGAVLILGRTNIGSVAAMLAIINTTPLFLGGRTNPLADFIGIPLSTYYVFHHFIGRVVITEGVIHAALAFRQSRLDQTTTSGYIAFGGLLLLLFTSFYCMRRYFFRSFAKIHLVLALVTLGATTWHVLSQTARQSKIIILVSGGVWVLTTTYMCIRLVFYATGATITDETGDSEVSRITVSCNRRVHYFPGSYFYIFPPGSFLRYNLLASYPMAVLWYEPDIMGKGSTELAFLVLHSRPLKSLRFRKGERLLIDGPYGQDLNLSYFKSVMLAAHGAGILGVLSIARSLWERRRSDDVLCRVNIFWSLERNSQAEWAAAYLKRLQELDAGNELFVVWCVYPFEEKETPVFEETSHWLYFHQVDPCGDPDFSADVRKAVIDRRATRPIDFVEVQYRPSSRLSRTTSRTTDDVDSEQGSDKLSTTDNVDLEKGRGKLSTTDDVDLEKGGGKSRRMHREEDEEWDEITLYSPTGTLADDTPQKTWQKKTD
ncbi:hypothetical protein F4824DRAFT_498917 [Ustulina deusta]|nr:hypothetical protein F4824DRAFT_498917 [Ustulina deusta]